MTQNDIDRSIQLHTRWRRQFLNAFAGGNYADMPLSEHRSCTLAKTLAEAIGEFTGFPDFAATVALHARFHSVANEIVELSNNGMASSADLLLPELNEITHQLNAQLDKMREHLPAR